MIERLDDWEDHHLMQSAIRRDISGKEDLTASLRMQPVCSSSCNCARANTRTPPTNTPARLMLC